MYIAKPCVAYLRLTFHDFLAQVSVLLFVHSRLLFWFYELEIANANVHVSAVTATSFHAAEKRIPTEAHFGPGIIVIARARQRSPLHGV